MLPRAEAPHPRFEQAARGLLWLGLAWVAAWALRYAAALVAFPYQVDWR